MANPVQIEAAITNVRGQQSFVQDFLTGTLDWPISEKIERVEDVAYGWSDDDLRAQGLLRSQLIDGQVWQFQPFRDRQPWGIFLLELHRPDHFGPKGRLSGATGTLRKVLRGLVPSRRRDPGLTAWKREHLLFICTHDYQQFRFAYFKAPAEKSQLAPLRTFGWNRGETHLRTLCEFNLPPLAFPADHGSDGTAWVKQWEKGFDVEAVTKRFFAQYAAVFTEVEAAIEGVPDGEPRRLYTQRLFNRLMFLYFVQRKGWLSFQGDKNYLRALFNAASNAGEDFLNERLYWTFFYGLNTAGEHQALHSAAKLKELRREVPFLNGGLFDLEDEYDVRDRVKIPNEAFAVILDLFERYNFTVTESTPLDVEVAVDPEMLGKVFEELVTGRHETGSYYTPRPIVAFMCREALKHYLEQTVSDETAVTRFVEASDPSKLPDPEAVLNALRSVKVCDPACGSGAYLLGMMQELLRLREALFATRGLDSTTVYRRKLDIIQNNLYGVDIDVFAVNIAKLRLWLSLVVDFDGLKPPPLPNLDFKIERGDSLTAPDPQELPDLFRRLLVASADRLAELKGKFLETYGAPKKKLAERIKIEETKLRDGLHEQLVPGSVDWRVAFAEVFKTGGFDIALENPPYVRMELIKEAKAALRRNFPQVYVGGADLYVYFFARTYQILRPGGTACLISANKWMKARYGESLRRYLANSTWVACVVDFGHAKQIFQDADVFPLILVFRKPTADTPPLTSRVCAIARDELRLDDLSRQIKTEGLDIPREQLGQSPWTLESAGVLALLDKIRRAGVPLEEYAGVKPLYGIKTGLNEAFLIDAKTRDRLITSHRRSAELIKPYLRGQDIERWTSDWAGLWMIFSRKGTDIDKYPAIRNYLSTFQQRLEPRPKAFAGQTWPGRKPGSYRWHELQDPVDYWREFEAAKICIQRIAFHSRVAMDTQRYYLNDSAIILPTTDPWLLAVLNSPILWYLAFRTFPHKKDEALAMDIPYVEELPIPTPDDKTRHEASEAVQALMRSVRLRQEETRGVLEWLRVEFGIEQPNHKLQHAARLDENALVVEVQRLHGKTPLDVAAVAAVKAKHARSIAPMRALAAESRQLERRLAELINAAYGLSKEDIALMWRTAPPRMPGEAPLMSQEAGRRALERKAH